MVRKAVSMQVVCSQSNIQAAGFKGSYKKTENGTPYYSTNSGTIAGGILAVPAALLWLSDLALPVTQEEYEKIQKNLGMFKNWGQLPNTTDGALKKYKTAKKLAVPFAVTAAGLSVACGALVDSIRNKKAAENADLIKQKGLNNVMTEYDGIEISSSGRAYTTSNAGKKYGALLGAGCGILNTFMAIPKMQAKYYISNAIFNAVSFGLGGLIMGAAADYYNNKSARQHA